MTLIPKKHGKPVTEEVSCFKSTIKNQRSRIPKVPPLPLCPLCFKGLAFVFQSKINNHKSKILRASVSPWWVFNVERHRNSCFPETPRCTLPTTLSPPPSASPADR